MRIVDNPNALPFGSNQHLKLNINDIELIQKRYSKGERIASIHKDYQHVTRVAIEYWAYKREGDLERRKRQGESNSIRIRNNDYWKDYNERRKNNGLSYSDHRGTRCTLEQFEERAEKFFKALETHDTKESAKVAGYSYTEARGVMQSKKYKERYTKIMESKAYHLDPKYTEGYCLAIKKDISYGSRYSNCFIKFNNPEKTVRKTNLAFFISEEDAIAFANKLEYESLYLFKIDKKDRYVYDNFIFIKEIKNEKM